MFTYDDYDKSATIYGDRTNATEWSELSGYLSNNKLHQVYFHYVSYFQGFNDFDLLSALNKATDLKSVLLKGSSFYFNSSERPRKRSGLGKVLDSLHSHQHLEYLQLRNYDSNEMDEIFENLVALLENNQSIKKLSLWHVDIKSPKFKLFCDFLSKPGVELELDLEWSFQLSKENKLLLKHALQANKSIKISQNIKEMLDKIQIEEAQIQEVKNRAANRDTETRDTVTRDAVTRDAVTRDAVTRDAVTRDAETRDTVTRDAVTRDAVTRDVVTRDAVTRDAVSSGEVNDKKRCLNSNLNFLILSGCLEVAGIAAVAIAFTVLNAATLGIAGLVVAGLGAASILAGIGLFAYDRYKTNENRPNSNLEFEASLTSVY